MNAHRLGFRLAAIAAGLLLSSGLHASIVRVSVTVPDLVLKDGAHYTNIELRTYDPALGTVMALDGKTFVSFSTDAMPPALVKQLNSLAPAAAFQPEKPSTVVPLPYHPPVEEVAPKSKSDDSEPGQAQLDSDLKKAKQMATSKAENYFRYEHRMGSGNITVQSLKIDWDGEGEAVQGWTRRYRFEGKAYIDYFESVGYSFNRVTSDFEITLYVDDKGVMKVADLSVK